MDDSAVSEVPSMTIWEKADVSQHPRTVDNYNASMEWFASHMFYSPTPYGAQAPPPGGPRAASPSVSMNTSASQAQAAQLRRRASTAALSQWGRDMNSVIRDASSSALAGTNPNISPLKEKLRGDTIAALMDHFRHGNLSVVYRSLRPLATADGRMSTDAFTQFVASTMVPRAQTYFAAKWFALLTPAPSPPGLSSPGPSGMVDIVTVLNELEALFSGAKFHDTVKHCFDLCDLRHNGFILIEEFKNIRNNAEESEPDADLTYIVVQAIIRIFDHMRQQEEEAFRASQSKKGKKKKNAGVSAVGGGLFPAMPGKRKFHIDINEFKGYLSNDPHLVIAFLPFVLKKLVEEPDMSFSASTVKVTETMNSLSAASEKAAAKHHLPSPFKTPQRSAGASGTSSPPPGLANSSAPGGGQSPTPTQPTAPGPLPNGADSPPPVQKPPPASATPSGGEPSEATPTS